MECFRDIEKKSLDPGMDCISINDLPRQKTSRDLVDVGTIVSEIFRESGHTFVFPSLIANESIDYNPDGLGFSGHDFGIDVAAIRAAAMKYEAMNDGIPENRSGRLSDVRDPEKTRGTDCINPHLHRESDIVLSIPDAKSHECNTKDGDQEHFPDDRNEQVYSISSVEVGVSKTKLTKDEDIARSYDSPFKIETQDETDSTPEDEIFQRNRTQLFNPPLPEKRKGLRITALSVTFILIGMLLYFAYVSGALNGILPGNMQPSSTRFTKGDR